MKLIKTSLTSSFICCLAVALGLTSLTTYVANAHPYAANISGTNGSGVVSFVMNEGGANVDIVFEDNSTNSLGVIPSGKTNFTATGHTSWQIICSKVGNGVPSLISSDAHTNGTWANPRGFDINKNPKIGNYFGALYAGASGPGGLTPPSPFYKDIGLYVFQADENDLLGYGTNAHGGSAFIAGGAGGLDPFRLRVNADNTIVVGGDSIPNAGVWQFSADLLSSNMVLGVLGRDAGAAAGIHGREFGTPYMYGSLANSNLVLWTADNTMPTPSSTNTVKGPGTSPNDFNCLMRYDIGAGEYYITTAAVGFGLATAATNSNVHLLAAAPDQSRVSTATVIPTELAAATVNPGSRLATVAIGSYSVGSVALVPSEMATAAIVPSSVATVAVNTNSHALSAVLDPFRVATVAIVSNSLSTSTLVSNSLSTATVAAGGTLYHTGDILTIAGGTGTPATVGVSATNAATGAITAVTNVTAGSYTALPATTNAATGGSGSGVSLTLKFGTGSGYTNGTVLTLAGGTGTSATVTVTNVSTLGVINGVTNTTAGNYSSLPATPNSPTSLGTGTGAKLALGFGTGSGYANGNVLTIAGGTGVSATITATSVSTLGVMNTFSLSSAGSYTVAPSSPNSPTGGAGANATVTLTTSGTAGSGYAVNDVLTLSGGTGTPATLRVASIGAGGAITSVTVVSNGNYTVAPANPNFPSGGFPGAGGASLNVTYLNGGGTGYTPGDVLTILGGTGTPATVTVNTVNGSGTITAASMTSAGNYTALPVTPNSATGGTGTNAFLTLTFGTGSGYTAGDVLALAGGTGTPATVTVTNVTALGVITGFTNSSVGNYSAVPATPNTPTGGSGTAAKLALTFGTGSGYANGNVLTIAGGTPSISSTVTVTAVSSGIITAVSLTSAGTYSSPPPTPNSPTGGAGTGATLALTITGAGGSGYTLGDTLTLANSLVTAAINKNSLSTATITSAGTGYTNGSVLTIAGGTGTAATVTVTSTNLGTGAILTISNSAAGNYSVLPATPNTPTGGSGSGASLTLTFGTGSGYAAGNVLTLAGGTGTAGTVTVTNVGALGVINGVSVNQSGNYTAPPASTNSPTGGAGANANLVVTVGTGTPATVAVASVGGGGAITSVSIASAGSYSVTPGTPNGPTGGTGSGARLNLTFIGGGGTGYSLGDVLTLSGGTGASATVGVSATNVANGAIVTVTNISTGNYTALPPSTNFPTGGTGTGGELNLTFGTGADYTNGTVLTIAGGSGTAATCTVSSATNGVITAVNLSNAGNYTVAPPTPNSPTSVGTGSGASLALAFGSGTGYAVNSILNVNGGTGSPATIKVTSVSALGAINAVSVNSIGNYTNAPASPNTPTNAPANANFNLILVAGGGTGYLVGDLLTLAGGAGTPATVSVTATNPGDGAITGLSVASSGNYSVVPGNPNFPTGGHGTLASLDLTFNTSGGTSGGTGYTVGDILTISGGGGSIIATVTVAGATSGAITNLTVTYPGRYAVAPGTPNALTTVSGGGSGAIVNLVIAGPLNWNHAPNYSYTLGLQGIATLRTEFGDIGKDGKIIGGFGRGNLSNPDVQILDPSGSNVVWTSWNETGGLSDPWNGVNAGGGVGEEAAVRVSPDGVYLACVDINNGITFANMTNGVPDDSTIFGIANAPTASTPRGGGWDAADNFWVLSQVSSPSGFLRCYSLGLTTTCITSNDFSGTNGSFALIKPGGAATVAASTPIATQNYVNNFAAGQGPGTPIPGVFTITLNTGDLTGKGPTTVPFVLSGSATRGVQYQMLSNALLANGVIITTTNVTFPPTVNPLGANVPWSVDIPVYPTANPISGPSTTVGLKILAGNNYSVGVPFNATITIINTGPQLLSLSAIADVNSRSMNRGIPGDFAKFTLSRLGDLQGPGNGTNGVVATTFTVTNWIYLGTATNPLDYKALAQVQTIVPPYNNLSSPVDGVNSVTIAPNVSTLTVIVGNPVKHTNPAQAPTNLTIIVSATNRVAVGTPPSTLNAISSEGLPFSVALANNAVVLNELDNTIGKAEVVLWSNPLTNAADSVNWTAVFANTVQGPNPVLPVVIPNYPNDQIDNSHGGPNDFIAAFGKNIADDSVPPSDVMTANGWNTALKVSVNKQQGAEAGLNLYPHGVNLHGNYAIRFDMYLSLYRFATNNGGDQTASIAGREYAAFGVNHYGTNCNWRLDSNPRPPNTGSGPTNSDGQWYAIDASSGAITPNDFDYFTSPAIPNSHQGVTSGTMFLDQVSAFASAETGIFKHPPFNAIFPLGGGEPVNEWVDVSVEITSQTNIDLLMARQVILSSRNSGFNGALTNTFYGPPDGRNNSNGAYISGTPMLGYLDPNAGISDPNTAFAMYSNVRAVEMSPWILAYPTAAGTLQTNDSTAINYIAAQFSSMTLTSTALYASNPLTNQWFRGTNAAVGTKAVGWPTFALQTNSVAATNMNDSLTVSFTDASTGTNYMCVFSDAAGSVTSRVVSVEVVLGAPSQTINLGTTPSLPVTFAGATAPTVFQWYFNTASNAPFSSWTKLANSVGHFGGVTNSTLFVTNILAGDAGFYWAATTNAVGGVIPQATALAVVSPPTLGGVTPLTTNVFWGQTVSLGVTNNGTAPFTYQWKTNAVNLTNNSHYAGATNNILTITNVTRADATTYSVLVTNAAGSITPAGTVTVSVPAPTVSSVSVSGGNATLSITSPNPFEKASGLTLQSAGVVTGPYTNNATGAFTGSTGGPFSITVPTGGDTMFFRLLHAN